MADCDDRGTQKTDYDSSCTPRQRLIQAKMLDALVEPQVDSEDKEQEEGIIVEEKADNLKRRLIQSSSEPPITPTSTLIPDEYYEFEESVLACSVSFSDVPMIYVCFNSGFRVALLHTFLLFCFCLLFPLSLSPSSDVSFETCFCFCYF